MNDMNDIPGLIMRMPSRDLSHEEDRMETQRRITAFHLWMLARPRPASDKATANERDARDDDKTREG